MSTTPAIEDHLDLTGYPALDSLRTAIELYAEAVSYRARKDALAETAKQIEEHETLLRIAVHAATKLSTMYQRREVEPRSELDDLIDAKERYWVAIRALRKEDKP